MAPEIFYAILGVISFTSASFLFRAITHRTSPLWMNAFKALLASGGFLIVALSQGWLSGWPEVSPKVIGLLLVSGLIGLNLSDSLMLRSYARMGPARTIIVYRFQPLYLALLGYLILGETLTHLQIFAVFLLIGCVVVLSHEGKRHHGHWDLTGVGTAFLAMILDGSGVMLSRLSFAETPSLTVAQANVIRCAGALLGFAWISLRRRPAGIGLVSTFRGLEPRFKWIAIGGTFLGTFLGLSLWLKALSLGNAARVSAVGGLAPVIAIAIEAVLERQWPRPHAWAALVLCLVGVSLLI